MKTIISYILIVTGIIVIIPKVVNYDRETPIIVENVQFYEESLELKESKKRVRDLKLEILVTLEILEQQASTQ